MSHRLIINIPSMRAHLKPGESIVVWQAPEGLSVLTRGYVSNPDRMLVIFDLVPGDGHPGEGVIQYQRANGYPSHH